MSAGLAIYDTMQFIKPDVSTICIGQAASMGAVLLTGGAKGKRYALPFDVIDDQAVVEGDIILGQAADVQKGGANYVAPFVPRPVNAASMHWSTGRRFARSPGLHVSAANAAKHCATSEPL